MLHGNCRRDGHQSPSPGAPSISFSVHKHNMDWLGNASTGFDRSRDVDVGGERTVKLPYMPVINFHDRP